MPGAKKASRALYKGERGITKLKFDHIKAIIKGDLKFLREFALALCDGETKKEKMAEILLNYVQNNVKYTSDDPNKDWFQFPIETVFRRKGDCEDSGLLYAALCKSVGIDVVILNPKGHIAVGIAGNFEGSYFEHNKRHYYYAETVKPGWVIGALPSDQDKPTKVIPI